jgi:hypothetical protein
MAQVTLRQRGCSEVLSLQRHGTLCKVTLWKLKGSKATSVCAGFEGGGDNGAAVAPGAGVAPQQSAALGLRAERWQLGATRFGS